MTWKLEFFSSGEVSSSGRERTNASTNGPKLPILLVSFSSDRHQRVYGLLGELGYREQPSSLWLNHVRLSAATQMQLPNYLHALWISDYYQDAASRDDAEYLVVLMLR